MASCFTAATRNLLSGGMRAVPADAALVAGTTMAVGGRAVVTASGYFGYRLPGIRGLVGLAAAEDGAFWTAFLRSLKARGLAGAQLVIADAHLGLRQAVGRGDGRCRHPALPGPRPPQRPGAGAQGRGGVGRQFPRLETMLGDAAEDLLAFTSFRPSQ